MSTNILHFLKPWHREHYVITKKWHQIRLMVSFAVSLLVSSLVIGHSDWQYYFQRRYSTYNCHKEIFYKKNPESYYALYALREVRNTEIFRKKRWLQHQNIWMCQRNKSWGMNYILKEIKSANLSPLFCFERVALIIFLFFSAFISCSVSLSLCVNFEKRISIQNTNLL